MDGVLILYASKLLKVVFCIHKLIFLKQLKIESYKPGIISASYTQVAEKVITQPHKTSTQFEYSFWRTKIWGQFDPIITDSRSFAG